MKNVTELCGFLNELNNVVELEFFEPSVNKTTNKKSFIAELVTDGSVTECQGYFVLCLEISDPNKYDKNQLDIQKIISICKKYKVKFNFVDDWLNISKKYIVLWDSDADINNKSM